MPTRKPYPSDVSDEDWAFVDTYLTLVREDAPQRTHELREVFNALLRWTVRAGASWRMLPHDFPTCEAVYQQRQRGLSSGALEAMVYDLRALGMAPCALAFLLLFLLKPTSGLSLVSAALLASRVGQALANTVSTTGGTHAIPEAADLCREV
jgi:transposase